MKSAIKVIKEQIEHFYLIRRLSLYELKSKNKSNYLGMAWEVSTLLSNILYIGLYLGAFVNGQILGSTWNGSTFYSLAIRGIYFMDLFLSVDYSRVKVDLQ